MIDTVFSKELMLNTVISWERREKPCKFSFTSTCDLGAGRLGPFVQLVARLCVITWPSYFTAIGCSFPTGGTEMVMLYKNRRNFRNNEFVRNPLICVWAKVPVNVHWAQASQLASTYICLQRGTCPTSERVSRSWTQKARAESRPCSALREKTLFSGSVPPGPRWQDHRR